MVDAALPKLDTMRWSVDLQRIHVTLAIYVTRTQFEGIQDRSSANTFSELCSFPVQGGTFMENVVIGNATYVVSRVFIGDRNVSELIQKRVEASSSQLLPLTNSVPASYNDSGKNAGLRRNHAN